MSSSSSSEGSNPCPICLGPVNQEAYLDRCFHKFCYNCIAQWANLVASKHSPSPSSIKCPLCKTDSFSIIHGCDGNSFQQHYINKAFGNSFLFSTAHKYRVQCYDTEPGTINDKFDVQRYWRSRKYLQPNRWLQSWLRREIQALTQEDDVDIIVHHILGVVESILKRTEQERSKNGPETEQKEFKALVFDAVMPFLTGKAERFVNEVELFLASGLNVEAYDEVYLQCLGLDTPGVIKESTGLHEATPQVPYLDIFDEDMEATPQVPYDFFDEDMDRCD